jgi:cold shock CspA family protein
MSSIEETSNTPVMHITGQVKWFNNKAGYGFITVNSGEQTGKDIFTHYSAIRVTNSQYKYLVQGEYVEFDLVKSTSETHEYQALNVSGISGGSLMCETRRNNDYSNKTTSQRRYNVQRDDSNAVPRTRTETDSEPREYRQPRQPRQHDNNADSTGFTRVQRTKPRPRKQTA